MPILWLDEHDNLVEIAGRLPAKRDNSEALRKARNAQIDKDILALTRTPDAAWLRRVGERLQANDEKIKQVQSQFARNRERIRKENKPMGLQTILKAAERGEVKDRDEIADAVARKAEKVAKAEGVTREAAEARIWQDDGGAAYFAYQRAPLAQPKIVKRDPTPVTDAERTIEEATRLIMKRDNISAAAATERALLEIPHLYERYERERGQAIDDAIKRDAERLEAGVAQELRKMASAKEGECPKCGADVDPDDKHCSECGTKLKGPRPAA